jgi:hypothetical protein
MSSGIVRESMILEKKIAISEFIVIIGKELQR